MGQVFGKLLSQQKKHQKDELLEDPAARSHNFGQVPLRDARKSRWYLLGYPHCGAVEFIALPFT